MRYLASLTFTLALAAGCSKAVATSPDGGRGGLGGTGGRDAGQAGGQDAGQAGGQTGGQDGGQAGGQDGGQAGGQDGGQGGQGGYAGDGGLPPCTDLKGTITTLAKGVYCVTGDVIIPAGTRLDVPPGTELIFLGRYHFGRDPALQDVQGAASGGLRAKGTAAEPIIFRGATKDTGWFGITISFNPDPVELEYVTIRDAYKDDHDPSSRIWRRGGALSSYVNNKGTIIRHCSFINNRSWMVGGALDINSNGLWPDNGPEEITDTLFEDNSCECGVYYVSSADDKCGGGAIHYAHVAGPVTIARNTFRHNRALGTPNIPAYGGAIGAFDSQLPLGAGNVFDGNTAQAADGAISCAGHPKMDVDFISVDPSNVFTGNSPDIGCGR